MNPVLDNIKKRRSTRSFRPEQIQQETLDLILDAGIHAPSGHNAQAWHFTVIQDAALIQEISAVSKEKMATSEVEWMRRMAANPKLDLLYGAPTVIVVSGKTDGVSWKADCAAAIQNILLAAESLNVGSVWIGLGAFYFASEGARERLQIPEGHEPYYIVSLGYKADETVRSAPPRREGVIQYIR